MLPQDVQLRWFAHPWTVQKAAFNAEQHYLQAQGKSSKTGISKTVVSQTGTHFPMYNPACHHF